MDPNFWLIAYKKNVSNLLKSKIYRNYLQLPLD